MTKNYSTNLILKEKIMSDLQTEIEKHRALWAYIAKKNKWYFEPFYVQVWVDDDGEIRDSVSYTGLAEDIIVKE